MSRGTHARSSQAHTNRQQIGSRSVTRSIALILAELLLTLAAICGLYVGWLQWWTGVESAHVQDTTMEQAHWAQPANNANGSAKIAQPQAGEPPVQPQSATTGELMGRVYIPRFGDQWERNLVQGTSLVELNQHGLGHYEQSQMPGQIGNVAIAGHRNGYGQPLGDVDKLKAGDAIVIRSQDYWYVYHYTNDVIVTPQDVWVVSPNPSNPSEAPTKRMITLTTCEPKYTTPTHRWISFGEFSYWAKVSDGVPKELTKTGTNGNVQFISNGQTSWWSRIGSLDRYVWGALALYGVIFIAAAIAWRWPALRAIREGRKPVADIDIYGWVWRHQPGAAVIRWVLMGLLVFAGVAALFQWGFPWAAQHIEFLRQSSNYVTM